jgi:hypothetical protein
MILYILTFFSLILEIPYLSDSNINRRSAIPVPNNSDHYLEAQCQYNNWDLMFEFSDPDINDGLYKRRIKPTKTIYLTISRTTELSSFKSTPATTSSLDSQTKTSSSSTTKSSSVRVTSTWKSLESTSFPTIITSTQGVDASVTVKETLSVISTVLSQTKVNEVTVSITFRTEKQSTSKMTNSIVFEKTTATENLKNSTINTQTTENTVNDEPTFESKSTNDKDSSLPYILGVSLVAGLMFSILIFIRYKKKPEAESKFKDFYDGTQITL